MTTLSDIGVRPRVLEILGGNPSVPYSIIADEVGVSRERVRQIARRNGYPPRSNTKKIKTKLCPVCGRTYYTSKLHCSRACAGKTRWKRITLNCHQCGKPIERTPGSMRNKSGKYFCNRKCFGRWVGKSHTTSPRQMTPIIEIPRYEAGSVEKPTMVI